MKPKNPGDSNRDKNPPKQKKQRTEKSQNSADSGASTESGALSGSGNPNDPPRDNRDKSGGKCSSDLTETVSL